MEQTDTTALTDWPLVPGTARLFVEVPSRAPFVVELGPQQTMRIGRDPAADLIIDERRVSRFHVSIRVEGDVVVVEDLGSSNGTFLGVHRVTEPTVLDPGIALRIGDARLFLAPSDGVPPPRRVMSASSHLPDLIAEDPVSLHTVSVMQRLAASELPVLITGETGTGKELVARALHRASPRAAGPFVAINCAALAESLAESELFGHERGSFTGANVRRIAVFESADGGALLLDEIGELTPAVQAKLLRALQERAVQRVGANRPVSVDVRILAATNRDLAAEAKLGRFREDLYYRLAGATLTVAPLRDRARDIDALARHFVARGRTLHSLSPALMERLHQYDWPGNVRELEHAISHCLALAEGKELLPEHLPAAIAGADAKGAGALRDRVDQTERQTIVAALERNHGNQSKTARMLGISRRALIYKMERHGLKPPPGHPRLG